MNTSELSLNQKFKKYFIYKVFFTALLIGGSTRRKQVGILILKVATVLAMLLAIIFYRINEYYSIGVVFTFGICIITFIFIAKRRLEKKLLKKGYLTIYSFQKSQLEKWIKHQKLYEERCLLSLRGYSEKEFKNSQGDSATITGVMIGIVVSLFDSLKGLAKLVSLKNWEALLQELIPFLMLIVVVVFVYFTTRIYFQMKNTEAVWMGKCSDMLDDILYQYYQKH